tara:strand:+ start:521 stop:1525 length:1005 start_codon:yes stop_codon:yes gene_type:complete
MAINFPATAGQATDGTFTYTVAGITYAWNGSSWAAAGAGASATNRSLFSVSQNSPAGGGTLAYDPNSGSFSYTPPSLSGFLTTESDTLATVTGRGASTTDQVTLSGGIQTTGVTFTTSGNGKLSCNGDIGANCDMFYVNNQNNTITLFRASNTSGCILSDTAGNFRVQTLTTGVTISGTLTAGGLVYPTNNGVNGQVLTSNGAGNVTWSTPAGARTTSNVTNAIANEAVANTSLVTPKTYALIKVQTSHAAWVTLYSDTASRTADASRGINVDPLPGSGVLSEVITTGAQTQLITPGVICFNSAGTGTTYAKVVNKSGSTANLTVTLTYVVLES